MTRIQVWGAIAGASLCAIAIACPAMAEAVESKGADQVSWSSTPAAVAIRGELPAPPVGTSDLKFHEFFKLPVGPLGLEPTEKLMSLDGKRVRIIGYMVAQANPVDGAFILTPLPVSIGDDDESLADDLPPSAVFVHLPVSNARSVPYIPGLIKLSGVLSVGSRGEADGRVSGVRLQLDPEIAAAIAVTKEQLAQIKKLPPQNR